MNIAACTVPGTIAITFDDGPFIYTSALLDLLDRYGAKVTFFVNGDNFGKIREAPYPDMLWRMVHAGHQIGSHTWNHADLNAISSDDRRSQMASIEQLTAEMFGAIPTYMRPPYGNCNAACLADLSALGYHVIGWNVDTLDYNNQSPSLIQNSKNIFNNAVANGGGGKYISLEHDVHQYTVTSFAEYAIQNAQAKGYRVVTVGECLGDFVGNWYRDARTGAAVGR